MCKTVLHDTNPRTSSAADRCRVLTGIISRLTTDTKTDPEEVVNGEADSSKVSQVAFTVESEEKDLKYLKGMLGTQGTLRPIFESRLKQKRSVREKAMSLRKRVAESGLDYKTLEDIFKSESDPAKDVLKKKVDGSTDEDIEDLISLLDAHFNAPPPPEKPKDSPSNVTSNNTNGVREHQQQHSQQSYQNNYRGPR